MTFKAGSRLLGPSYPPSKGIAGLMKLLHGLQAAEGVADPDGGET
jgi:hypothetical protein